MTEHGFPLYKIYKAVEKGNTERAEFISLDEKIFFPRKKNEACCVNEFRINVTTPDVWKIMHDPRLKDVFRTTEDLFNPENSVPFLYWGFDYRAHIIPIIWINFRESEDGNKRCPFLVPTEEEANIDQSETEKGFKCLLGDSKPTLCKSLPVVRFSELEIDLAAKQVKNPDTGEFITFPKHSERVWNKRTGEINTKDPLNEKYILLKQPYFSESKTGEEMTVKEFIKENGLEERYFLHDLTWKLFAKYLEDGLPVGRYFNFTWDRSDLCFFAGLILFNYDLLYRDTKWQKDVWKIFKVRQEPPKFPRFEKPAPETYREHLKYIDILVDYFKYRFPGQWGNFGPEFSVIPGFCDTRLLYNNSGVLRV